MTPSHFPAEDPNPHPSDSQASAGATPANSFPVVGVGASAGGLQAFTSLLHHLPAQPGFALLLVQHLDPTHDSLLTEILARETPLPVVQAADGMRVAVNQVYVIPPDVRMGVRDGAIRLHARGDRSSPHLPVDFLFRSLAEEYGPRAAAVVLSGGGTDGALGLGDIREAGGVAFAQEESTAGHPSMPASAFAGGNIDAVLSPEGIAAALLRLVEQPDLYRSSAELSEPSLESLAPLFAVLRKQTRIDFTQYKQNTIRRRVHRRLILREFASLGALVQAVQDDPAELAALTRDLLIGVTRFFRDPELFERLKQSALPTLLSGRPHDAPVRVWICGCATGEEAYSLAILLLETLGDDAETPIKILATDVNEEALARARAGLYPENIAADVSPERLRRFFRKAEGGYRVAAKVRDLCVFARHDLTVDPPFARMDFISCRNVLIYFDAALQRRIMPLFHYALRPGGYLLIGPAESIGQFTDLFTTVERDDRLYIRSLAPSRHPLSSLTGSAPWGRVVPGPMPYAPPPEAGGLSEVQREADRVLSRYAPAGVLVDDNLQILQFRGETEPYLRHPHGAASLELVRMVREGLLTVLQEGLATARSGANVCRRGVHVGEGDQARTITLHILPLAGGGPALRCFLILFETESDSLKAPPPVAQPLEESELQGRLQQVRRELETAREHQQAVVEEYEAANEELKSANEEILASNEELQSTNEELQTAKEEMQSANEELETVNDELQHRNLELGRVNDDLRSLLVGVNVPVIVVGRDLRIRRLTAQAEVAFGLKSADVGRPLRDVGPRFQGQDLAASITRVIDALEAAAFECQEQNGRWYSVRIRPYESGDNRIEGAVITAVDIDALKQAEAARRDLELKMFQSQKLESLGVMAGGVAHDLNNLLTPVLGFTELAQCELPTDSHASSLLAEALDSTKIAIDLVQQILAYTGKGRREAQTVDLSQFIRSLDRLLGRAVAPQAEFRYELSDQPLPIEADLGQLSQVILNLVTNAAEAARDGRGTVTLRTRPLRAARADLVSPYLDDKELPEGDYALFEIADNGFGMSDETLAKLFDPFYTTKFTGRGLGLAAVLGIVRGHRGSVQVQSTRGLGSTFRILLPLSRQPLPAAPPPLPSLSESDWRGSGAILVVDDDPLVRKICVTVLERAGFSVLEAVSGAEAIASFLPSANDIRAALVDLTMPQMGGREVAAALRAILPTLPILLMSGFSQDEASDPADKKSYDRFLPKPFTSASLIAALRILLDPASPSEP